MAGKLLASANQNQRWDYWMNTLQLKIGPCLLPSNPAEKSTSHFPVLRYFNGLQDLLRAVVRSRLTNSGPCRKVLQRKLSRSGGEWAEWQTRWIQK